MKGYSHALSGAAGWLALTSTSTAALGVTPEASAVVLGGSILCAGAALAPDCDHPEGTIAWSLPPVKAGPITLLPSPTRGLCKVVAVISGGHRHATHSIVGIAVFTVLTFLATRVVVQVDGRSIALACGIIALFLVAFAVKALGINRSLSQSTRPSRSRKGLLDSLIDVVFSVVSGVLGTWLGPWILALGSAGVATWYLSYDWGWLPLAMALGCVLHCVGDSLTIGGVPWLWPLNPKPPKWVGRIPLLHNVWQSNGYFAFPVLGKTESARETVLSVVMGVYVTYLMIYEIAGMTDYPNLLY